jgi:cell division protein FtsW (lipid II flippase)
MSVTYTSAADRTLRHARADRWRLGWPEALLAGASVLAILAIALAYAGIAQPSRHVIDLNSVQGASALEPALAVVFADHVERQAVAQELFRFVSQSREQNGNLPNVGALARARVQKGTDGATVPLLTSSQLAELKPLLSVRTQDAFRNQVIFYVVLYVLGFHVVAMVWRLRGVHTDPLLLVIAHVLTAIGAAALLARPDPLRDAFLLGRYTEGILIGLALMAGVSLIKFNTAAFFELSYLPLLGAFTLSIVLLLFGSGPAGSSAKVNLGPVQPIEAIRLLLALFLAGYFARRWELLRSVRETSIRKLRVPSWLDVPRMEYVLPVAAGIAASLFFFFLQKDLGPALYTCCVFFAVYAVARGRAALAIAGLAVLALAFSAAHLFHLSQTLVDRVAMWRSPWDNTAAGGDQIAHAMWAMSTGGLSGTGLGLGDTRYLPAGHTDLILAAIGEEQGAIGLLLVATLYALLVWRGFRIGRLARSDYGFFMAITMTLFLIVPALIMASGIVGAAPLTGVVTPFLSYGGSAMVTNFVALGVLASIYADRRSRTDVAPFRAPLRALSAVLGTVAIVLIAVAMDVQVIRGNDFVVRPQLGVQADGGRRFAYNPRVLDIVRQIPRGTIYDRSGLPLASDSPEAIAKARETYRRMGIAVGDVCRAGERCYPLGGASFHLLGDARSRLNWSAPNTSYAERDAENALRGFDDHATIVAGALRRDYSELVPLLRGEETTADFLKRPRDVRLTIDGALQARTASIVASYAARSAGKGAAVVLDADTGDVLASVSYPWPEDFPLGPSVTDGERRTEPLLDRARYGLYPPGSTFKLVTAAAALRKHDGVHTSVFACSRLSDGRVGAKIPGWGRPVRDDVLNSHPHGNIDLRDGLVRSCNAYFAQLALKLGPEPLAAAASQLGIALTRPGDGLARVRATLPQIGYGQGDVLATPLRMARVAAAIAANGRLPQTRVIARHDNQPGASETFLDPDSARLLARYMREAVLTGTGRSLREHPMRIAGKTGTAEVANKPSHSWFVGFAPYGSSAGRIAFAIIIENAGYGSVNAAPAAGEIVTAAGTLIGGPVIKN